MDLQVQTKGYRILNKVHRLPASIIENLVNYFGNFQEILHAPRSAFPAYQKL